MPKFRVASNHEVLGHKPGEVFEGVLSRAHGLLLGIGHLVHVKDGEPVPEVPAAEPDQTVITSQPSVAPPAQAPDAQPAQAPQS